MDTKVRHHNLDLLKVIAIFAVCIYHFWYGGYSFSSVAATFLNNYTYPFLSICVPMFFMVNGALLLDREGFNAKKHYQGLLRLVAQYFVWYALTTLIMGILAGYDFFALGKAHLLNVFFFQLPVEEIEVNHLWFIPALCCVYMLYPFYKAIFSQDNADSKLALKVFLIFIYVYNFLIHDFDNFKALFPHLRSIATYALNGFHPFAGYIATMSFYFLLGGILHKNREKLKKIRAFWGIPMILAGLCLAYATRYVTALTNPIFDIVFDAYNTNGTLLCALGTWLLAGKVNFSFLQKVKLLPLIRCISENTLTIFYTHWILGSLIRKFCTYPVGHLWNLLHGVLLVSVGTLLGLALKRIPLLKHLITR